MDETSDAGTSDAGENPDGKAARALGRMVPGHRGRGRIWQGAPAHPAPGPGRPPSAIRDAMRRTLDETVLTDMERLYVAGEIDALAFASFLAKYGLGEKSELTTVSPDVTARLQQTVDLIADQAPGLLPALSEIWR